MTIIYKIVTSEGHRIKILAEMLTHCIKLACFELNEHGIFLRTTDNENRLLLDLKMEREKFKIYKCTKTIFLGVNVIHLYKMMKSIKKKDSIVIYIDDDRPNDLAIQVGKTTSFVKIQNVQNIDINLPEGYGFPIVVSSSNFQKLVKGLNQIYEQVNVTCVDGWIRFLCDAGEVYSREVEFGDIGDDEKTIRKLDLNLKKTGEVPDNWYHQTFHTYQLVQLIKIAGLSSNIRMFTDPELPFLLKINIGDLGELGVYIKSIEQTDKENEENIDSDSDFGDFGEMGVEEIDDE